METIGIVVLVGIACVLLVLCLSAGILLFAAAMVGIPNRSFGKALAVIIIGGIASFLISIPLNFLPLVGTIAAIILGFLIEAVLVQAFFSTGFGKALAASIISYVLTFVLVGLVVGGLLLAGGAGALSPTIYQLF